MTDLYVPAVSRGASKYSVAPGLCRADDTGAARIYVRRPTPRKSPYGGRKRARISGLSRLCRSGHAGLTNVQMGHKAKEPSIFRRAGPKNAGFFAGFLCALRGLHCACPGLSFARMSARVPPCTRDRHTGCVYILF